MFQYKIGIAFKDGTWIENVYNRDRAVRLGDFECKIYNDYQNVLHVWLIELTVNP